MTDVEMLTWFSSRSTLSLEDIQITFNNVRRYADFIIEQTNTPEMDRLGEQMRRASLALSIVEPDSIDHPLIIEAIRSYHDISVYATQHQYQIGSTD